MRELNHFWKHVCFQYRGGLLALPDNTDFFSAYKHWLRDGAEYRHLVEPLDIANWYKNGNRGHYIDEALKVVLLLF